MKTTNTKLINILLWAWIKPNLLVHNFLILWKLIKKYGKMLFTQKYIKEISNIDQGLWNLILILKATGNVWYQDTKNLVVLVKRLAKNYCLEFEIESDSKEHNDDFKKYINTKFQNSQINTKVLEKIWVSISWEWRYYKKDLDSDLGKILGK